MALITAAKGQTAAGIDVLNVGATAFVVHEHAETEVSVGGLELQQISPDIKH